VRRPYGASSALSARLGDECAVVATAQGFRYDIVVADANAGLVTLKDFGAIKVTDEGAGKSAVTLELETVSPGWLTAIAVLGTPFYFAEAERVGEVPNQHDGSGGDPSSAQADDAGAIRSVGRTYNEGPSPRT
jgi:hypothetical protein